MITLHSLAAAFHKSIMIRRDARRRAQAIIDRATQEQAAIATQIAEEQRRRDEPQLKAMRARMREQLEIAAKAAEAGRIAQAEYLREQEAVTAEKQRLRDEADAIREAAVKERADALLDADGSRAAARAAREEQLKQERLDFIAAQYAIIN